MSAVKLAVGAAVGLLAAGVTTRVVTEAAPNVHGIHIAMSMLVPAAAAFALGDAKEEGTYGRGALYGIAAGGLLMSAFVSTFTMFDQPATGFFGESKKRNEALRSAAAKL